MTITGCIYDPQDGACLAKIKNDTEVVDATDREERQVGTVHNGILYDMNGTPVGHLRSDWTFKDSAASATLRKLLYGNSGC